MDPPKRSVSSFLLQTIFIDNNHIDSSKRYDRCLRILRKFLRLIGQDIFVDNFQYTVRAFATPLLLVSFIAPYIYTISHNDLNHEIVITAMCVAMGLFQVSGIKSK